MLKIFFGIIILIFAIDFIRIMVGLFTVGAIKKVKCKVCSGVIDSSCLKCNLCGVYLEKKFKKPNKILLYSENLYERKKTRVLKKIDFWKGDFSHRDK